MPTGRSCLASEHRPSIWRNVGYRWLWTAATVSNFGSMVNAVALPFVAVAALDAGPADLAWLAAARTLPGFALGLLAAAWVERLRRRPVLIAADIVRALLVGWIPLAAWNGWLMMWQLQAVALGGGFMDFVFHVAHVSILPAIVPKDRLIEANSKLRAADAVTEGTAFASAGALVQWLGAPFALIADALSFLISAACLGRLREREREPTDEEPVAEGGDALWREVSAGMFAVLHDRLLAPLAGAAALAAFSFGLSSVVYLLFVYEELGFAPAVLGLVFAAGAGSSLIGALTVEPVTRRLRPGMSMSLGMAGLGLSALLVPLAPGAGLVGLALLTLHQLGDGWYILFEVNHTSLRQRVVPDSLLARVNGFIAVAESGAMLAGAAVGGLLGEWHGLRTTLVASGIVLLVGAALIAGSAARRVVLGKGDQS